MKLLTGKYKTDNTDLLVKVLKVQYQNDTYVKFKGELYNASNGILYERRNYKVYKDFITHWTKVFP